MKTCAFVLAHTDHGTLILNHLDEHKTAQGSYGVGYCLLKTGSFDRDEGDLVLGLLKLRRDYYGGQIVVLDCGANIGAFSIKWAHEIGGGGEIYAFEAQERLFYALAGNIALNNCFNARAFNIALGNPSTENATINLPQIDYTKPSSFGSLELRQNAKSEFIGQEVLGLSSISVPLRSLDSFDFERVDFIKIDVEGMEMEVLAGAKKLLQKCRPLLQIELLKSDLKELSAFLQALDYAAFQSGINALALPKECPILKHIQGDSLF